MAKEELDYLNRSFLQFFVKKQEFILFAGLKSDQGGIYEK